MGVDIRCTCDDEVEVSHPCPFAQEINNDNEECACCAYCTEQCAMDV